MILMFVHSFSNHLQLDHANINYLLVYCSAELCCSNYTPCLLTLLNTIVAKVVYHHPRRHSNKGAQ